MVLSEKDGSALVRTWILEFACKHGMKEVISELLKQNPSALNLECADCGNRSNALVNPTFLVHFLFSQLSKNFDSILRKPVTLCDLYTIDIESLALCVDVAEHLYTQDHFIEFKTFYKMHGALKLLSLILRVSKQEASNEVMKHLDLLFPACTEGRLEKCITQFGLTEQLASTFQKREKQVRVFVLQLLVKESKRQEYMRKRLLPEVQTIIESIQSILPKIIETGITSKLPETRIDQILANGAIDSYSHSDPAVKLFLEFVQPNLQEKDLISVIHMLDPSGDIGLVSSMDDELYLLELNDLLSEKTSGSPKRKCGSISEDENASSDQCSSRHKQPKSSTAGKHSSGWQITNDNVLAWSPVRQCSVCLFFTQDFNSDNGKVAIFA